LYVYQSQFLNYHQHLKSSKCIQANLVFKRFGTDFYLISKKLNVPKHTRAAKQYE
jgi:hypothetical protein